MIFLLDVCFAFFDFLLRGVKVNDHRELANARVSPELKEIKEELLNRIKGYDGSVVVSFSSDRPEIMVKRFRRYGNNHDFAWLRGFKSDGTSRRLAKEIVKLKKLRGSDNQN